ncbi:hypothetical protein AA0119_g12724 [Alternaria tenuissima]|uniref:Uncharacterized protein n=1 Tax=Alternaria tenuissima TaxID=119927 RepID=A0ABY0FQF8_9PLEO|nr:hypothetical protein AA0111_g9821 [Alternaria arborescens]RYN86612.1 hypothetical protein AA0119_g12724 [Alternaria tenuissima]RYO12448.1 hypothetical protein AA0121_g9165 [Alternaria tenuissima]RYO21081.1 hypothetical protein AA0111_g9821 [Alternaria arborescens]
MFILAIYLGFIGAAGCLPQPTVPPAVATCYTLPIDFAVNLQSSIYRPCFCIRDHNALVTSLGKDEPCLLVRSAEAEAAGLDPRQYSQWFWETTEGYRYSYAECWRDDISVCQMVLGSQERM